MERNTNMWEKHWSVASCKHPEDQTCNPGKCPDGELNLRTFTLREDTQPAEPHCSGEGKLTHIFMCHLHMWSLYIGSIPSKTLLHFSSHSISSPLAKVHHLRVEWLRMGLQISGLFTQPQMEESFKSHGVDFPWNLTRPQLTILFITRSLLPPPDSALRGCLTLIEMRKSRPSSVF